MILSRIFQKQLTEKSGFFVESLLIVLTSVLPLFFNYPYRINLFLAWEGAYRISIGQIPYHDFGSPVGYGFWVLPALFFKIFGPFVYTLLIVQAFINVIAGLVFRSLLKTFDLSAGARLLPLSVFILSYSMFNFWPWYNHLVFIIELSGICILCKQIVKPSTQRSLYSLSISAFLIAFAFLTKQDTGALALFLAIAILLFDYLYERRLKSAFIFIGAYALSMSLLIVPFLPYEFLYWFNVGQFPHNARVDKFDFINEFLGGSDFIKLYCFLVLFLMLVRLNGTSTLKDLRLYLLFVLLTTFILFQAAVIQVTSYTPIDGNIYFHSFAIAFLVFHFKDQFQFSKLINLVPLCIIVCVWWSGIFWSRFLREKVQKALVTNNKDKKNVISKNTYLVGNDSTNTGPKNSRSKWVVSDIPSFKRIKIPQATVDGIKQIMALPIAKKKDLKVLNMSELTSLAYDMGYKLESGPSYPLWFHRGVAFFDREINTFSERVSNQDFDIILFEDIPNVNQFYPYEVRDNIVKHYKLKFKFLAPRIPEISYIEVYCKE